MSELPLNPTPNKPALDKLDRILEDYRTDLPVTCCTNEDCDGWHPMQDKEEEKAIIRAKAALHRLILKERREALKELQGGYMHKVVDNWGSSVSVGGGFRPSTPAEIYRDVQTHYENLIDEHIHVLDAEIEGSNHD